MPGKMLFLPYFSHFPIFLGEKVLKGKILYGKVFRKKSGKMGFLQNFDEIPFLARKEGKFGLF